VREDFRSRTSLLLGRPVCSWFISLFVCLFVCFCLFGVFGPHYGRNKAEEEDPDYKGTGLHCGRLPYVSICTDIYFVFIYISLSSLYMSLKESLICRDR
jgi:dolichyl-phosphate-mannose--protein O-mannosyl transferase